MTELTRAQVRVLRAMHKNPGKDPFSYEVRSFDLRDFQSAKAGNGSYANMVTRLCNTGLLHVSIEKPGVSGTWEITAKGLRAIDADAYTIEKRDGEEKLRRQAREDDTRQKSVDAELREEVRKARIITKVRNAKPAWFHLVDDGELWEVVTRIVEIHESTT